MASVPVERPALSARPQLRRVLRVSRQNLFLPIGGLIVLVLVFCALFPTVVASGDPTRLDVARQFAPPSSAHWLGTDEVGRDLWTRLVHGTRYSIGMSLAVIGIGATFGIVYGSLAGYFGGGVDDVMMRVVDVFLSLPAFILAMAIAASIGRGVAPLVAALAIVWWPGYARLSRGMVLTIKERPHVEGAHALGATSPYILRRHIIPLMFETLNVRVTQDIGYALVGVASLNFIGLGVHPPTPEWGLILSGARQHLSGAWWYAVFPGLAIALTTIGFSLLGDGLAQFWKARL